MEQAEKVPLRAKHRGPAAESTHCSAATPAFTDNSTRSTALNALIQMLRESPQVQAGAAVSRRYADMDAIVRAAITA